MKTESRADLRRRYKEEGRPMGVYAFRNAVNGRMLIGASQNLPGAQNSLRFQLRMGSHRNRELQADWKAHGEASFTWDVLDELKLEPGADARAELDALERLWLDELEPYGERGYNRPPAAEAA
ncbi:MAG TPA: GIY-YIG nuclease family protein [Longimicrobium sp.]|nr:GIY-YIG nuclease family protein [Longimicrobium sp.]